MSEEQVYVIQFPAIGITFACRNCGKVLSLKKPELGCTSNTFCPKCRRAYWVDWQAGVLHMGLDDDTTLPPHTSLIGLVPSSVAVVPE